MNLVQRISHLLMVALLCLGASLLSAAAPGKIQAESYSVMAGVATETCTDTGGGLDVGWIDKGDWMVYPITIATSGQYTISYRVASPNGSVSLSADLNAGATVLGSVNIPNTGGWQTWTTVTQTVNLTAGSYNFGINAGTGGFNLNWFSIDAAGCSAAPSVPSGLTSPSKTTSSVSLSWSAATAGAGCTVSYIVYQNGNQVATTSGTSATISGLAAGTSYSFTVAATDAFGTSAKSAALSVTTTAVTCSAAPSVPTGLATTGNSTSSVSLSWTASTAGSACSISYIVYKNGAQVMTVPTTTANVTGLTAGTSYSFTVASTDVAGTSAQSSALSASTQSSGGTTIKIEAENYSAMSGIATESCSDTGGGLNVGWIDAGDWMVYPITITTAGSYTISYRVATPNSSEYLSADLNAGATQLGNVIIPNTGGWQTWQTVTQTVTLPAGSYNFGINAGSGGYNLNWFSITGGGVAPTKSAKRGIAYDLQTSADLSALKSGVSWWYNWGAGTNAPAGYSSTYGMDYVPMSWNGNNIAIGGTVDTYLTAHPECKYLLVINEPNLADQSNLSLAQAVSMWPQIETLAQKHGVKIVGPAMNWGTVNTTANPANPITWLDGFFSLFQSTYGRQPQVDAIAFHWYDYGLVGGGTGFLDDPTKLPKYGKKIWVTEFANWHATVDGAQIDTVAKQKAQMQQWVSWMETHDLVERYSWFTGRQPNNPCFVSIFQNYNLGAAQGDGVLGELGQYYVSLPVGQ